MITLGFERLLLVDFGVATNWSKYHLLHVQRHYREWQLTAPRNSSDSAVSCFDWRF